MAAKARPIGELVKTARGDMTRNALAVKAGLDPAYLMRLERGDVANPSFHAIAKIAAATGAELDFFKNSEK